MRCSIRHSSSIWNSCSPVSSCHSVLVAVLDAGGDLPRVDVGHELAAGLEVEQPAGDVLGGDLEVHRPLAVGQRGRAARTSRRR